ncbi:MAG TPA: ABC transporter permease [Gemmatimonadaceae bacterium]|nr:ABC transporter permease [Gemmatimonadaceae bacterium]
MRLVEAARENVTIALATLRVNKLRSALTVLGVVIGVSTVMTMASIVQGISEQIINTIEVAGPNTFYVMKVFSQTPLDPNRLPKWVRIRPDLREEEAERIASLPEVGYAAMWVQLFGRFEYQGQRTQPLTIFAADDRYSEINGGDLLKGRWFSRAEVSSGAPVVVLTEKFANRVFGAADPIGKTMRVLTRPVTVVGVVSEPANIFSPPGQEVGGVVPYRFAEHSYTFDKTNQLFIVVKPREGVSAEHAHDAVMIALRNLRHLHPGDPNTFDFITQDQILDVFKKITDTFFLVMISLSGVGLLVGGIGVMAIMMVSVTDRTREIGVRKALGARRTDILLQFLVEAATLTGLGGGIGIVVGLAAGKAVTMLMRIQASAPVLITAIAVLVSVAIGVVFGLYPATRAARLDPVEALRYE